jgi:ATP-dependent protease ClpP protease subunit
MRNQPPAFARRGSLDFGGMRTFDTAQALPPHPPSPRKQLKNAERFRARHMSQRSRRVGYVRQHWRGDLPLAVAVICSAGLLWGLVQAIGFASRQLPITEYPIAASLLWLLEVAVLIVGALWWGTGVQRSAIESVDRGGSMLVAVLTGVVGLGAFVWVCAFWFQSARYVMPEVWSTLIGSSPAASVQLDPRADQIVLQGALEFGSTRAMREVLDANPNVRIVRLDSRGGRVAEGLALGTLLRDRNVDTFVHAECSSACATAFAGGARRVIGPHARIGLHSAGGAGFSADVIASANKRSDEFIAARGVDQRVLQQGAAVANDQIWFPSPQVLLSSGLATEVGR